MICRVWKGWTLPQNADAYEAYLRDDLFPRVAGELGERGYRGHHVLRLDRAEESEFVTMVWFASLESVRSFAGEDYETPVISATAQRLLSRYNARCDHYTLRLESPPDD
jgi:heme-degrading monooxygenase HmoA